MTFLTMIVPTAMKLCPTIDEIYSLVDLYMAIVMIWFNSNKKIIIKSIINKKIFDSKKKFKRIEISIIFITFKWINLITTNNHFNLKTKDLI